MSWHTYRRRLLAANPLLGTPDARVTLSAESLLRQLEKAYQQAVDDLQPDERKSGGSSAGPDFFGDFFRDLWERTQ